jgi:hypothetical protein
MSQSGGVDYVAAANVAAESRVQASSGMVANAAAVATLAAVAGRTTYLTGFEVTAGGATAGSVIDVSVAGCAVTLHYAFTVPTGAAVPANPLLVEFTDPIPSSAPNTAIVVTCPAAGAGNTGQASSAHGYYA